MLTYLSSSADETEHFAETVAKQLIPGDTVAYLGDLGAGKTAFTRGLARGLGITCDVTSPTFALLNIYGEDGPVTLYHFDMYRVDGFESLCTTGFFDYLGGDGIVAVEWSENIRDELPKNAIMVTITPTGETSRRIEVEGGRF